MKRSLQNKILWMAYKFFNVFKTVTYIQNAMPLGALFYECLLTFR
jgi:hypothetical protein